jgi:tetratricopeptide (TPR) repeat protein
MSAFEEFNQGVRFSLEGADDKALAAFERALALQPDHVGAIGGMGMSLARLGRIREALEYFRRAIALEPGFAEYHRQAGLCLLQLVQVDEARAAFREALRLDGSPEFRERCVVEIYNFGAFVMRSAAQWRDAGQAGQEQNCYRMAFVAFLVAHELDGQFAAAARGLPIVCSCLGKQEANQRYAAIAANLEKRN